MQFHAENYCNWEHKVNSFLDLRLLLSETSNECSMKISVAKVAHGKVARPIPKTIPRRPSLQLSPAKIESKVDDRLVEDEERFWNFASGFF